VPLYTLGQNSRDEKYIQTSITEVEIYTFQEIMASDDFGKEELKERLTIRQGR